MVYLVPVYPRGQTHWKNGDAFNTWHKPWLKQGLLSHAEFSVQVSPI